MHSKDKSGRATVAFVVCHVINRHAWRRIVVDNCARAVRSRDGRVTRVTQMNGKVLVRLERGITFNQHRYLLGRFVGCKS